MKNPMKPTMRHPMRDNRSFLSLAAAALLGFAAAVPAAQLVSVSSRVTHGKQSFDVPLSIDQSAIEPRNVKAGMTLVLTFDGVVSDKIQVKLDQGAAKLGAATIQSNVVTVPVERVTNGQEVTVSITQPGSESQTLAFRTLQGDVNADTVVDEADARLVKAQLGKPLNNTTARFDVSASGAVEASDAGIIRKNRGERIIGQPFRNTPPTITPIAPQRATAGRLASGVSFVIGDRETPARSLMVFATSDNPRILPNDRIHVTGDGANRMLTIDPLATLGGAARVTVRVSDGLLSTSEDFDYELEGATSLFVGRLTPQGGAVSPGSGAATLLLAGDELTATLKFNYTNLTGPETAAHIHGPADPGVAAGILFDIDTATPNADGSYTWTFVPSGTFTAADQVNFVKQGKTYLNIHTAAYPNGEIRGQFIVVMGSQTFTPPPPAPALPSTPHTQADAARFLTQATFGPTEAEINRVVAMGYEAWIEEQFQKPQSKLLDYVLARQEQGEEANNENMAVESWWNYALIGEDQLRLRVAFALSQIFVISLEDGDLNQRPREVCHYYDMVGKHAFGNYRTLLEDVSLNPQMGQYLDMRNNRKAAGTQIPNENYSREILQLFSVGLYQLHPDGTLKLSEDGSPIDTYGQAEVTGLARVFTGWNWHQALTTPTNSQNPGVDQFNPMTLMISASVPSQHEFGSKQLLGGALIPSRAPSIANAMLDLADAHNNIFAHNNTGPFICKQLIQRLVTSNPSPGYVYRISQVFADNGRGVRGDIKAVVKAILLDYEARAPYDKATNPNTTSPVYTQGYGKLREPLLRLSAMARAFRPSSASGLFRIPATDTSFLQSALRSPTVFNFFEPGYSQPGNMAVEGLLSPEFQILNEISVVSAANVLESATRNPVTGNDVRLDFSVEQAIAGNATALVDRLNLILMYGQMSTAMRTTLIGHVGTLAAGNPLERVRAAVHLIVTSSEFSAQR